MIQDIYLRTAGKPIEAVEQEYGLHGVVKLGSNENPLGPSPKALAAMRKALASLNLYPDGNAFYLKQKLATKLGVKTDTLILGNGSNEIIEFIGHALMAPGTDVVVSQYCFAIYPIITKMAGANLITVPARDLGHDLLGQHIQRRTDRQLQRGRQQPGQGAIGGVELLHVVQQCGTGCIRHPDH